MINKIALTTMALSALLLSGCGGSSSEKSITDKLKEKDAILIIHETKSSVCSLLADTFTKRGVKNILLDSPDNTASCATYGRVRGDIDDDNAKCAETTLADFSDSTDISLLEDTTKACVIGGDN